MLGPLVDLLNRIADSEASQQFYLEMLQSEPNDVKLDTILKIASQYSISGKKLYERFIRYGRGEEYLTGNFSGKK